jgi:hypothetical protein
MPWLVGFAMMIAGVAQYALGRSELAIAASLPEEQVSEWAADLQ